MITQNVLAQKILPLPKARSQNLAKLSRYFLTKKPRQHTNQIVQERRILLPDFVFFIDNSLLRAFVDDCSHNFYSNFSYQKIKSILSEQNSHQNR